MICKKLLSLVTREKREIRGRGRVRLACECRGVHDARMQRAIEWGHHFDPSLRDGIGGVHDAERGFASRHQHGRDSRVLGACESGLHDIPDAEGGERFARVASEGYEVGVARCESSSVEPAYPVAGIDASKSCRLDHHQSISGEWSQRTDIDALCAYEFVHPLLIRGDENVCSSARLTSK